MLVDDAFMMLDRIGVGCRVSLGGCMLRSVGEGEDGRGTELLGVYISNDTLVVGKEFGGLKILLGGFFLIRKVNSSLVLRHDGLGGVTERVVVFVNMRGEFVDVLGSKGVTTTLL